MFAETTYGDLMNLETGQVLDCCQNCGHECLMSEYVAAP